MEITVSISYLVAWVLYWIYQVKQQCVYMNLFVWVETTLRLIPCEECYLNVLDEYLIS